MERRGDGVAISRRECGQLTSRLPEYSVLENSELRLVVRSMNLALPSLAMLEPETVTSRV